MHDLITTLNPSITKFNNLPKKDFFYLRNDCDSADVVPLYRSLEDVLAFQVHYIKSSEYLGYEICKGEDCPHCKSGISKQTKLFIPFYNVQEDAVQFWDRGRLFYNQVEKMFVQGDDITKFVYRITRKGHAGNPCTTYYIRPIAKNTVLAYDDILKKFNISFPEAYSKIIRGLEFIKSDVVDLDTSKKLTPLVCVRCGAPLDVEHKCCNFCGVHYIW